MNPDHYAYRVIWSAEDEEYVGLCSEFPSLSWLEPTPDEAFSGIRRVVAEVLEDMLGDGETPPEPIAERSYSGNFTVRVPPELHRALALRAAEEGVSLNRLVSARLASL
ncbi:MAG: toxin-antitoxin system HicB family antitoxin [Chloroflexi bacterium]|nr:toxin-antitoxin system HicB family antitoxin [Chloroflexota bacterium]MYE41123.1 toxin-antitoxin system HicB family antitoxin [Chloroflexota bacterium]